MLSRDWAGDAAFALRDCDTALRLEPGNTKAMHRRVAALRNLHQIRVGIMQQHPLQTSKIL